MSLLPGASLGSYSIVAPLGAGGMGEVFRARDAKLNRDVALKILSSAFANDPDRLMRFEREAQTLAALNHPNIAAIYGIEEADGIRALVMELVDGDDLSVPIARGPMPLADALPIARQIADALEAAHEAGVVHRDLKPANVKVKADGRVKVLDFGLAKAVQLDASGARPNDPMLSPTMTSPAMTQMGMILGTAAYMSPEQARGRPVDRRADIWAFGVVLYEMLTGRRAFQGNDVSDLLVSVLRDSPDFSALPAETPVSVRRLLRRCIEKDPRKRLSAIGDARLELDDTDIAPPPATEPRIGSRRGLAFAAAGAVALMAIAATAAWYAKPAVSLPVRLLELPASIAASNEVVLSPDGTRLAYFLNGHLFVRALDTLASQDVGSMPATSGTPFWSPDSRTIGFWAESEIRTVPATGGPVFAVCKVPATGQVIAARWLDDGAILFAVWRDSVYAVPAAGGKPTVAFPIDPATEIDIHHLSAAPGGRLIVMIHQRSNDRVRIALVDGHGAANQHRVDLTDDPTIGQVDYAPQGYFIFTRGRTNAGLWAAPFAAAPIDLARATLLQAGAGSADVARDGSAIFLLSAPAKVSPVWIDRTGAVSTIAGAPVAAQRRDFAVSPDGRRVAIVIGGEQDATLAEDNTALIVRDLETGADTSLTFRDARGRNALTDRIWGPSWFPAGDRILYSSGEVEAVRLAAQRSDEATPPHQVAAGLMMGRICRDGRTLAGVADERGRFHLVFAPLSPDGAAGSPQRVFHDDEPDVDDFDVSPDGSLVVFAERLADRRHSIVLSEFPQGTSRWQVAESASQPRFSRDGREIFYLVDGVDGRGQPTRTMTARTISARPSITLGAATELFGGTAAADISRQGYEVVPDGRRFLSVKTVAPAPGEGQRFIWMQNWPAVVKR